MIERQMNAGKTFTRTLDFHNSNELKEVVESYMALAVGALLNNGSKILAYEKTDRKLVFTFCLKPV